ncbi:MAG: baseplate J/gp47 family protein [Chitinophagales bacterium]
MSGDCQNKNPLQRSGVTQHQRMLNALDPGFVKADERDHADLILFAKNYAKEIKYYNDSNKHDGDWSSLMSGDIAVALAQIIKTNIRGSVTYVNDIFEKIRKPEVKDKNLLKTHFKFLFDFGFSLTSLLNTYYNDIDSDHEFKSTVRNSVDRLSASYSRLLKFYDLAITQPTEAERLINETSISVFNEPPISWILSQDFKRELLNSNLWNVNEGIEIVFEGSTVQQQIKRICNNTLFTSIFDNYLKATAFICKAAIPYLEKVMTENPAHSPHYGLFLSFIKLFGFAQDHLNTLTQRHLDLYYKDILHLNRKPASPDSAHLTFELAKPVTSYELKKDTAFKAGKDADGKEIFYVLNDDLILNNAAVKSLKNITLSVESIGNDPLVKNKKVFSRLVANSQDGIGGKLENADKSWPTFGITEGETATSPEIGFVVASNYLFLNEGTRKISFEFFSDKQIKFSRTDINELFSLQLTGEKGWLDVNIDEQKVTINSSAKSFKIEVTVAGSEAAIVPYSQKTHGGTYDVNLPLAKFLVAGTEAKNIVWELSISRINIALDVKGVKNLAIQNDAGVLNPSKPFEIFTTTPHKGSSFIFGNSELFLKANNSNDNITSTLHITWDDADSLEESLNKHRVIIETEEIDIKYLENGSWVTNTDLNAKADVFHYDRKIYNRRTKQTSRYSNKEKISYAKFDMEDDFVVKDKGAAMRVYDVLIRGKNTISYQISGKSIFNIKIPSINSDIDFSDNTDYSVSSRSGFIKLETTDDFGYKNYLTSLKNMVKVNGDKITVNKVYDFTPPKVKEMSLDYKATTTIDITNENESAFLHLTPFGYRRFTDTGDFKYLLPQFNNEGELFIGIDKITSGETVSVLFQVAEGTSDPLEEKQNLTWYYLGDDNEWIEFKNENVADQTDDLSNTGVIKFSVLSDAGFQNTLFPEQYFWIRCTVNEKTDAVCNLIDVIAQAAKVSLSDYKKEQNYFKANIPAETISKLVVSDSSIKKITQSYGSTGGRTIEEDTKFYTRVSERLRHKNRPITMWDYERMILEEFPSIYKVKCINHAQIKAGTNGKYSDNELKPGHVLIIPIPDLKNQNAFDPLRPNTSLGLLTQIKKFIYRFASPHSNIDVRNPKFEEIQLLFNVKYFTDDNDFYTVKLKEEIERFMAGWAYDQTTQIEFGGKIFKSTLINFIEERDYVDHISCVKMKRIADGIVSSDLDEIEATTSRSVFVSVKSNDTSNHAHDIKTQICEC